MARATYLTKDELKSLTERSDLLGAWQIIHCWGVIALAIAAFILFPYWWVAIPTILIIGSRQLGLSILMHDAAHGVLFKSRKLNDLIGQLFLAWPVGTDLLAYRKYHLKHHRHTQQDDDPDLVLSTPFPITRASLFRKFLRDIFGLTGLKFRAFQFMQLTKNSKLAAFSKTAIFGFVATNLALFLGFASFGLWHVYLLLWLLPLMTWFQWVLRVRNIAEHALTSRDNNPLTHARTTHAGLLARIFVAPYFVNYHIEHHAYMFIPCYRLKQAHKIMRERHGEEMSLSPSYLTVLSDITRPHLPETT